MLGRGLADLIPVGGNAAAETTETALLRAAAQEAAIASLHPNPRQPRTNFDDAALAELASSIRANGILQPILVRPRTTGGFEIVAGERRYRAALRAGLKQVPIIVRDLTDEETLSLALIENLIREDLGPLETARAFQRLMQDFGWTQDEMARRVGKSRPAISNATRLLELPEPIQRSLEKGELTEGHARALLGDRIGRADPAFRERQIRAWHQIIEQGLTVRDAEGLIKAADAPPSVRRPRAAASGPASSSAAAANLKAVEDRLRTALGTQVRLVGDEARGRIEIEFFSGEELDGLLSRFEAEPESAPASPAPGRPKRGSDPIQGLLSSRRPA